MRQWLSLHRTMLSLAAVITLLAAPRVILAKPATASPVAQQTFVYQCDGQPGSLGCLAQRYQKLTETDGVATAFRTLKAAYPIDRTVQADCHQLTHVIGRTEADITANLATAYAQGDNYCWSGYYHGVMESIVIRIGAKNLPSALPTICASLKAKEPYSFYHYNCVHGLGHGIMAVTNSDLFKSLSMCDLLTDDWEQQSCYGGVFMENEMDEVNPGHTTAYLSSSDPMYPCTAVGDRYKEQCYLMQTSHALRIGSENFSLVFTECGAIEAAYRDVCYQSLGRDASGNSTSQIEPTRANCMLGPTQEARSNCVIGAVKDFVSYFHSDVEAGAFCASLDRSLVGLCQATKRDYYATF